MEQPLTPDKLFSLLGGVPDKPPLDVRVLEVWEHGTHQRQLIEYTTESAERVQAFLLVPSQRAEKLPGIVAIHQDGARRPYEIGKSEPAGVAGDPELAYGLELCLRGYAVLCPDRFPFESRSLARSRFKEQFDEFRIFTEQGLELTEDLYAGCVASRLLFEGRTPLGWGLFELQRAVDCLCEQQEVHGGRVGAIGHSAGGFLTALLMYVDPRVAVGCSSCGTFLYRWRYGKDTLRPINGFAGGAVPGLKWWGDVDEILAGLAPRPFLETRGDPWPTGMTTELTEKARTRYREMGASERYQYVEYEGGHLFAKEMREKSYAWLDYWLKAQGDLAHAR